MFGKGVTRYRQVDSSKRAKRYVEKEIIGYMIRAMAKAQMGLNHANR